MGRPTFLGSVCRIGEHSAWGGGRVTPHTKELDSLKKHPLSRILNGRLIVDSGLCQALLVRPKCNLEHVGGGPAGHCPCAKSQLLPDTTVKK